MADRKASAAGVPESDRSSTPVAFLFERMSPDDPNYDLVKSSDLKSWTDSHKLVAKGYAGEASLDDFINGCLSTLSDGLDVQIQLQDSTPISKRCREMDSLTEAFISRVPEALAPHAKRLGPDAVDTAVNGFLSKARELGATAKARILEAELSKSRQTETNSSGGATDIHAPAEATFENDSLGLENPVDKPGPRSESVRHDELQLDLGTPEGRKSARQNWKHNWTTPERDCTNDDLTEPSVPI